MIKHYVEFFYPGILTSDTSTKVIPTRKSTFEIPEGCFGYRFFDIEIKQSKTSGRPLKSKRFNYSGNYYIEGKIFTMKEIGELMPGSILHRNMENNGYSRVVKTKFEQYMPLEKNDRVV